MLFRVVCFGFCNENTKIKTKIVMELFSNWGKKSRAFASLICYEMESIKWLYFHLSKTLLNYLKLVSMVVHQAKHLVLHFPNNKL